MFNKILVAIDGSNISRKALEVAIDEARVWKAELNVVYVIETGMLSSIPADNTLEVIYSLLETEGKNVMDESMEIAEKSGVTLNTIIRQGHAGNEIIAVAEEIGADIIIMGSHGKSKLDQLLIGSVTDHVVRHSKMTTLVVRS